MRAYLFATIATLSMALGAMAQGNPAAPSGIKLDATTAKPRTMEDLTRTAIARDYDRAWQTLAEANDSNSASALDAYFVGAARTVFGSAIESRQKLGLQSRCISQEHQLTAVFYAPEGDMVELQDTVRCQSQVLDGKKTIEDQPVVLHYIVLMTPAADRWMIRQMQPEPHF